MSTENLIVDPQTNITESQLITTDDVKGLDNDLDSDVEYILVFSDQDENGKSRDVKIKKKYALLSGFIKTTFESDKDETQMPINIKSTDFPKIEEFLIHYEAEGMNEIEQPLKSADMEQNVEKWYADYINVDQDELFTLTTNSNYLDIKPLLNLCAAKVASMIKGKTTEEIRTLFNIENDFTPEEEAVVKEENKWYIDDTEKKTDDK